MTPKEKAEELVKKFVPYVADKDFYGDKVEFDYAKQCALIAVDEILKLNLNDGYDKEYWQQVKTEIEKL